jgi:hypothetical protein
VDAVEDPQPARERGIPQLGNPAFDWAMYNRRSRRAILCDDGHLSPNPYFPVYGRKRWRLPSLTLDDTLPPEVTAR